MVQTAQGTFSAADLRWKVFEGDGPAGLWAARAASCAGAVQRHLGTQTLGGETAPPPSFFLELLQRLTEQLAGLSSLGASCVYLHRCRTRAPADLCTQTEINRCAQKHKVGPRRHVMSLRKTVSTVLNICLYVSWGDDIPFLSSFLCAKCVVCISVATSLLPFSVRK